MKSIFVRLILFVALAASTTVRANTPFCYVWPATAAGTSLSAIPMSYMAMALDTGDVPYVVYSNPSMSNYATVIKYDGTAWVTVGNAGFSGTSAYDYRIAFDANNIPYVAYLTDAFNSKVNVRKLNGASWVAVGGVDINTADANAYDFTLDNAGTPYVAYEDQALNPNDRRFIVRKFDGSNWQYLGPSTGITTAGIASPSIKIDLSGRPVVAFRDYGLSLRMNVVRYDASGNYWASLAPYGLQCGNVYSIDLALSPTGQLYVAYPTSPYYYNGVWVRKYNETIGYWEDLEQQPGITHTRLENPKIKFSNAGELYLSCRDSLFGNGTSVFKFAGTGWIQAGPRGFSSPAYSYNLVMDHSDTPVLSFNESGTPSIRRLATSSFTPNSGDTNLCAGTTSVLSNTTAGGYWYYSNYSVASVTYYGTVNATGAGSTTVTYTKDGCYAATGINVLQSPPAVSVTGGGTFCDSTTISASTTAAGTIYFQGTNSYGTSTADPSTSVSIKKAGYYTFRLLGPNGCWGPASSVSVNIPGTPIAYAMTGGGSWCSGPGLPVGLSNSQFNYKYQLYRDGVPVSAEFSGNNQPIAFGTFTTPGVYKVYAIQNGNSCAKRPMSDSVVISQSSLPPVNAGNDIAVCPGGSVTLSASGATSYSWNNGVSDGVSFVPSSSGVYTVTGTDASGCTNTDQVIVTVNSLPIVNAGPDTTLVCPGAQIKLSGSGAATYSWDHGVVNNVSFLPTATAVYTVTGTDANGCVNTDQVSVTLNYPTVTPVSPINICNGQSVTLTAPAGYGTYTWKKNGNKLSPKTNTCTVGSGGNFTVSYATPGCGTITLAPAAVVMNSFPPKPAVTPSAASICTGSAQVFSGPSGYGYQWYNNTTPITGATNQTYSSSVAGSYKLITNNNGCASPSSNVAKLTINPLPQGTFYVKKVNANGSLVLTAKQTNAAYVWYRNGNPISGATSINYTATMGGVYKLKVTKTTTGCFSWSNDTTITVNYVGPRPSQDYPGLAEDEGEERISVYPNPSTGIFRIQSAGSYKAVVRDMQGRLVSEKADATELDLTSQSAGIYLLQLFDADGSMVESIRLTRQ